MYYEGMAAELLLNRSELIHVPMAQHLLQMTKGELFVMSYLATHEGEVNPHTICEEMGVSTARMAALLQRLEGKGYIVKRDDPMDNRQILVRLTDEGFANIKQKRRALLQHIAAALEELGPDDAKEYVRIQKRIIQNYREKQNICEDEKME